MSKNIIQYIARLIIVVLGIIAFYTKDLWLFVPVVITTIYLMIASSRRRDEDG